MNPDDFYRYIYDDLDNSFKKIEDPYVRLWTSVLLLSVYDLLNSNHSDAYDWITDEENEYFNTAAEGLNYRPSVLRQKILKMVENRDIKGHVILPNEWVELRPICITI